MRNLSRSLADEDGPQSGAGEQATVVDLAARRGRRLAGAERSRLLALRDDLVDVDHDLAAAQVLVRRRIEGIETALAQPSVTPPVE